METTLLLFKYRITSISLFSQTKSYACEQLTMLNKNDMHQMTMTVVPQFPHLTRFLSFV